MSSKPTKTHKTAIVIIPPEEVWPPIQAIRHKHDRKVARWMPHITLIYPFVEQGEFDHVTKDLKTACRKCRPFDLELTGFNTFNHGKGSFTLWLEPKPEEALRDLHAAIWTAVSDGEDFEPRIGRFKPHLSVGQARGMATMVNRLQELQANWTPVHFRVSEVSLIRRNDRPDDVFRIDRTIPIGGS